MTENSLHTQSSAAEPPTPPAGALMTDEQIRWLRRAIMIMTTLMVAGIAIVIGRVIYLARPPATQAASELTGSGVQPALLPNVRLALPAGADINSISASGNRLMVLPTTPAGSDTITILDLSTGQTLSRVTVERGK